MKNYNEIDWENPYKVWAFLTQPEIQRLVNETDEDYRKRILNYIKEHQ